jgi:DnaJ-class molecular chaperone
MPADANSYERELARSVDGLQWGYGRTTCPSCDGDGLRFGRDAVCPTCSGSGHVEDYDAMDDADSAFERAGDR